MISTLSGQISEKEPGSAVIECCGVGYEVTVSLGTFGELPPVGGNCRLFVRHVIREDDERLYGFATKEERSVFDLLLCVSGVGPKLAVSVLDGLSVREFQRAVASGDAKRLASVKGLGKKTAERIIVDLKGKINPLEAISAESGSSSAAEESVKDAVMALMHLGFGQDAALQMVDAAISRGTDKTKTELLIRAALSGR